MKQFQKCVYVVLGLDPSAQEDGHDTVCVNATAKMLWDKDTGDLRYVIWFQTVLALPHCACPHLSSHCIWKEDSTTHTHRHTLFELLIFSLPADVSNQHDIVKHESSKNAFKIQVSYKCTYAKFVSIVYPLGQMQWIHGSQFNLINGYKIANCCTHFEGLFDL